MITLPQVQVAISTEVVNTLASDPSINIILQGTDHPYELSTAQDVIVRITVNFGRTLFGEIGKDGCSRRIGVLALSIYTLWGEGAGRGLEVADILEEAFRKKELLVGPDNDEIFFEDTYTEGGFLTDNSKFCYTTYAPFYVWVNE